MCLADGISFFSLASNGCAPLYEVGNAVNLTAEEVKYRLKRLQDTGFIVKYLPIINFYALGYTLYAVLMGIHNLTSSKEKKLECFLKTNENIPWAAKTIGKYNLFMYVCTKDSADFHNTLIELRNMFPADISDYETLISRESFKYTYYPKLCFERALKWK